MERQGLSGGLSDIRSAVSAMGGAHAQVMSAAELSIGIRVPGIGPVDVRSALRPGNELVKTYGVRGTVHLLPRDELALWCGALGTLPRMGSLPPDATMDAAQVADVLAAISGALAAGARLDADELGTVIVAAVGEWAADPVVPAFGGWWPRWRQVISTAAYRGALAFGESRGSRVTYCSPSVVPEPDVEQALRWLLRRYLTTYGPATPENYARWVGARKTWAAAQFDRFTAELEPIAVDGVPVGTNSALVTAGDTDFPSDPLSGVALLPHFDPYVIGSFPRERLFPGAAATRALGRGQAGVHPVLLVDGIVVGLWTAKDARGTLHVTVESLAKLSRPQGKELEAAVERIAAFPGLEAQLTLGPVLTAAHK